QRDGRDSLEGSHRSAAGEPQLPASLPPDVAACANASAPKAVVRPHGSALRRNPVVRVPAYRQSGGVMKTHATLIVTSLLSLLLLTLHVTDDIVRGISKAESSNTALLVLVVFLYGTVVLYERRSGHVIMLLVGFFAAAMPVIHMRAAHYGDIAKSAGGFF